MKTKSLDLRLDARGVDAAAEAVESWLTEASVKRSDMLRTRLMVEDLMLRIAERDAAPAKARLRFDRRPGSGRIILSWNGERFDPTVGTKSEMETVAEDMLSRIGLTPEFRRRGGRNELRLPVPTPGLRTELVMLLCVAAAVAVGLLGRALPEAVRTGVVDYALHFLTGAFMDLLNTFVGIMIFLSVTTGICGIGSVSAFGKVGKLIMSRFVGISFLVSAVLVAAVRFLFPLGGGGAGGGNPVMSVLETVFGILPGNPVRPFLEGNMLQIVFMAILAGVGLLAVGSESEGLRQTVGQLQKVVMFCVSLICRLLPVYIFCSLVIQFWTSGPDVIVQLWRPILICIVLSALTMLAYLAAGCRKLRVKPGVLVPKLMPAFLIGLTTASSAATFSTAMEIYEKRLGVDTSFARTAFSIGTLLCAMSATLYYIIPLAYMAERSGVQANTAWWIIFWLICTMTTMATPPMAGGPIACLTLLMAQMNIPQEGLAAGATLIMVADFVCTGARAWEMQIEITLQAKRLGLLDEELLRTKM